ncbi:WD40 repeat-containing protein [Chthonomonas calidirosea]|uniref:FOG: WD40 repeat n=1 Tax=Chthonomonas calidirosea (strain DSM 23976 / ICMP 18418 / T49) TaxID=1303518 RepID=S0EVX4_CHTCT|nr:tetratricopeptide repeat protein [Chthonomonas calidirosea]CCW35962.1 FOG: WD40 repeat [Chthonomonas calidirosea T49]CEK18734.1 WD40 repeat-containing protein [Chthonomonas calidirosea]
MQHNRLFELTGLESVGGLSALCFTPDENHIVVGSTKGTIWFQEARPNSEPIVLGHHREPVWAVNALDAELVASASEDGTVRVWHLEQQRCHHIFRAAFPLRTMVCADGLLVMGGKSRHLLCQDVYTWQVLPDLGPHNGEVTALALSADGKILFAGLGSHQGGIYVWDLQKGEAITLLTGPGAPVTALACHPKEEHLLAAYANGELICWHMQEKRQVERFELGEVVFDMAFLHPHAVVVRTGTGKLDIWSLRPLAPAFSCLVAPITARAFALAPGKGLIAIAASDGKVYVCTYPQQHPSSPSHGHHRDQGPVGEAPKTPPPVETEDPEGDYDLAKRAIEKSPSFENLMRLGQACARLSLYREALETFERAVTIDSGHPEARFQVGMFSLHLGEFAKAKEAFRTVLDLVPDHAPAHNNLGTLLLQAGQFDAALAHFRKAVQIRPNYPLAYVNLGLAYRYLQKPEKAKAAFQQAIELAPYLPVAHYQMGLLCLELGDQNGAREHYLILTQLDRRLAVRLREHLFRVPTDLTEQKWKEIHRLSERLLRSAAQGDTETVALLLALGASVHETEPEMERTALLLASAGGHIRTIDLLLDAGAEANESDRFGKTALYLAAEGGHVEALRRLLRARANPNFADCNGQTPLHVAASRGCELSVFLLLEAGAMDDLMDNQGKTPLELAQANRHWDCVKLLKNVGAVMPSASLSGLLKSSLP